MTVSSIATGFGTLYVCNKINVRQEPSWYNDYLHGLGFFVLPTCSARMDSSGLSSERTSGTITPSDSRRLQNFSKL